MNDTGECTLEWRDFLYLESPIHAAAAKGMPVEGMISPTMKPGITYTTTRHPDGTIHVQWEPTKKPGTASP